MKSFFIKFFSIVVMTLVVASTADAGWLCRSHNLRGDNFYAVSGSHFMGVSATLAKCAANSKDCTFDECKRGSEADIPVPQPVSIIWQCNASNAQNKVWTGTGESRAVAASNATGFCVAHSVNASNCKINTCFTRRV